MDAEERERIFEQALQDYRAGRLAVATKSLGRLVQEGSRDPSHISYYGLLLAFTHGRNEQSISLCEEAVEKDGRRSSVLYLNLARALAAQGRRREAILALERGVLVNVTAGNVVRFFPALNVPEDDLWPAVDTVLDATRA